MIFTSKVSSRLDTQTRITIRGDTDLLLTSLAKIQGHLLNLQFLIKSTQQGNPKHDVIPRTNGTERKRIKPWEKNNWIWPVSLKCITTLHVKLKHSKDLGMDTCVVTTHRAHLSFSGNSSQLFSLTNISQVRRHDIMQQTVK